MFLELRATPRPQPPAKTRKVSPLFNCYPPPPYSSMDSVLGSPIPGTAQLLGSSPNSTPASEDWIREKSREELSELLLKADGIIRTRESELGVTSAICKALHQDNVALKSKHDALMSRLPISYAIQTPVVSPLASPHLRNINLGRLVDDPDRAHSPAYDKASRRRNRRISMTQTEIGQLADQNSELHAQIEDLENEATLADQAGKRKLRKLELEIQGLRDELSKTQEELQAEKVAFSVGNEDVLKQRLDREEKLQALRGKRVNDPEIVDFAPPSHVSPSPASSKVRDTIQRSMLSVLDEHEDPDPSSYFTFPTRNKELHVSEHSLISQLLLKIRELEEANEEITQENRLASSKLQSAKQGMESMRRFYDCLSDEEDVEVQIVPEFEQEDTSTVVDSDCPDTTIRFSSLRRSINEDIFKQLLDQQEGFDNEIEDQMHSTMHASSPCRPQKTRKSVVGLFNDLSLSTENDSMNDDGAQLSPLNDAAGPLITTILSTGNSSIYSPQLSPIEAGLKLGQTLGSELGSEFGEDWNANAGNFHVRATSLYSLAQDFGNSSKLPLSVPVEQTKSFGTEGDNGDQDAPTSLPPQEDEQEDEHVPGSLLDFNKTCSRSQRLSQAMRSRTGRWVDGRLNNSGSSQDPEIEPNAGQRNLSGSALLNEIFTSAVEDVTGASTGSRKVNEPQSPEDDEPLTDDDSSVTDMRSTDQTVQKQGIAGFVVEAWLWLQFLIIIMVFLWAMAKRGPKSVLLRPSERKASSC